MRKYIISVDKCYCLWCVCGKPFEGIPTHQSLVLRTQGKPFKGCIWILVAKLSLLFNVNFFFLKQQIVTSNPDSVL